MVGIILVAAFELQEIVIATALFVGEFPADSGAGFVDGAAPSRRIEEPADSSKVLIFLAAHDAFVAVRLFGELGLGLLVGHAMVLGEPLDVSLLKSNDRVRAAIAGAVQAIVRHRVGSDISTSFATRSNRAADRFPRVLCRDRIFFEFAILHVAGEPEPCVNAMCENGFISVEQGLGSFRHQGGITPHALPSSRQTRTGLMIAPLGGKEGKWVVRFER